MCEADFTGMDAGEYYAMRDFEDRERAGGQEADLIRRVRNQREEINGLKSKIIKVEQSRDHFLKNYQTADKALSTAAAWLEQRGVCTHFPGYLCDKDFSQKGICAACIRLHLLKLAREELKE